MSLLMDALKKAEAAKRQGSESATESMPELSQSTFGEMSLEPISASSQEDELAPPAADASIDRERDVPTNLPELPSNLGGLDAEFVAHHEAQKAAAADSARLKVVAPETKSSPTPEPVRVPAPAPKVKVSPSGAADQANRDAARNMFDAKASAQPAGKRKFALVIGILSSTVALGIIGYFWWQYQSNFAVPSSNFAARPAPALTPTTANMPPATAVALAAPALAQGAASVTPSTPGGVTDNDSDAESDSPQVTPTPAASLASKKKPTLPVEANEAADAIRLVRVTKSPLQINPALSKAYEEFNRGNFAAAKTAYESLIKSEPHNVEALHGLAAIAVGERRWNAADHYYERILVADPKDAAALSALINLHGQNNPVAAESRLKGLATEQPDSSAAQFALGNLYASQQRWADAQQAYFKAYSADAENPDILYNLAVSLEHMNQAKLAHQYYLLALEAAKRRPAGFDIAIVGARAAALKSP